MRLHDRYLFRELITPMAACFGAFLVFWLSMVFATDFDRMREAKLRFVDIMEYAVSLMPGILVLVLPVILLLGMLWALTQHSRHNETTALRAAGVSLWRLCVPYFIVGLLAVGVDFALNEVAAPASAQWSDSILTRYVKKANDPRAKTIFTGAGYNNIKARRQWEFGQYDSQTKTMLNPIIVWTTADGIQHHLRADSAVFTNKIWVFFNASQFSNRDRLSDTNQLAMPEFDERPRQIYNDLKFNASQGTLSTRTADIPLADLWPYLKNNPNLSHQNSAQFWTKFHARLATPWTCFIVVLMAIPFGAPSGRRNLFYGVAGSIFICFAFLVLQQVSFAFGIGGHLPPWVAAWLPNIIFAAIGFFLTMRVR